MGENEAGRSPAAFPSTMHSAPRGWGRGPAQHPFRAQVPPGSLSFDPPGRLEVPVGPMSDGDASPREPEIALGPREHAEAKHCLPLTSTSSLWSDEASLPACPSRCRCTPWCRQCHLSGDGRAHWPFHSVRLCMPTSPHCCVHPSGLLHEPSQPVSRPCYLLLTQSLSNLPLPLGPPGRPFTQSSLPGLPSDLCVFTAPQTQETYPSHSLIPCPL